MNRTILFSGAFIIFVTGCAAAVNTGAEPAPQEQDEDLSVRGGTLRLTREACDIPGTYLEPGKIAGWRDIARDSYCGEVVLKRAAPGGFVAVFGSSRLKDGTPEYAIARDFGKLWTASNKGALPILTGGGPGLMEGANRGASEAGGPSLGFSTYFKSADDKMNTFVSDGYMFADFELRERAMLRYAQAVVVLPGGVGTAWEFFMTLSEVQTKKMNKIPIVLMGSAVRDAVMPYLTLMKTKGTISPEDIDLFLTVDTAQDAVDTLTKTLQHL